MVMKLWERIKKIKNIFWIILYILFLLLITFDLYDMYFYFDMWGGDAFPWKEYKSKEAYAVRSLKYIALYSSIFAAGIIVQKKHLWLGRILLMTPVWFFLIHEFFL